ISEEFIEAVYRRQILVQIAEVVLAELPGGVALRLQGASKRHRLRGDTDVCTSLSYRRQTGTDRQLAGDEVRPTRRAAGFGVIVGKHHAFRCQLVEVRRLPRHHSTMVSTNVEPADVVTHDDEDVRRTLLLRGRRTAQRHHGGEQCQHKEPGGSDRHSASHYVLLSFAQYDRPTRNVPNNVTRSVHALCASE